MDSHVGKRCIVLEHLPCIFSRVASGELIFFPLSSFGKTDQTGHASCLPLRNGGAIFESCAEGKFFSVEDKWSLGAGEKRPKQEILRHRSFLSDVPDC